MMVIAVVGLKMVEDAVDVVEGPLELELVLKTDELVVVEGTEDELVELVALETVELVVVDAAEVEEVEFT